MEGLIPILIGLVFGWVLLAGFGELWYNVLTSNWLKKIYRTSNQTKQAKQTQREKIIILCICRTISVLPVILLFWSIEHLNGLGKNLTLLTPILLIGSLWVYYSNWKKADPLEKKTRIILESGFFLTLILSVNIFWGNTNLIGGDKGGDLCHTATMASGETLPPTHPWLPPYKAEDYYRGQWYAGGLLARLCNLSLPQNYFVSYILCIAWITYAILSSSWVISRHRAKVCFLVLVACLFGSHFGPIVSYMAMNEDCRPYDGTVLVGDRLSSEYNKENQLTPLGAKVAQLLEFESKVTKPNAMINQIPCQPYSYHIMTGEWHSWYGGYLFLAILAVAIAGYTMSGSAKTVAIASATLGAIIPTSILFNTWITPLIAISVATTLLIGTIAKAQGRLFLGISILASIITSALTIKPISTLLRAKQYGDIEGLKMIATFDQTTFTPYLGWLIYAGPALLWVMLASVNTLSKHKYKSILTIVTPAALTIGLTTIAIMILRLFLGNLYEGSTLHLGSPIVPIILVSIPTLVAAQCGTLAINGVKISRQCWLALCASIIFSGSYALNEIVFLDDYLGKPWERWNTSNKWMPSILLLITMLCAPLALCNAKIATQKIIAYILLIAIVIPPLLIWGSLEKEGSSQNDFSGAGWIKSSPVRPIYEQLLKLEKGTVLEYQHEGLHFNTPGGIMPLLTGHKSYIGWVTAHLGLAYPSFKVINQRRKDAIEFYEGILENQDTWASENDIDYIVWSISLQKLYNKEDTWVKHPTEGKWERAWFKNKEDLKTSYEWVETKARPYREGLWIKKELLDSSRKIKK